MVDFKSYLIEGVEEDLLTEEVADSSTISEINDILYGELEKNFLSPEAGMQKIRQTLFTLGVDIPVIFDLDREGAEFALDISGYGLNCILYVLYSLSEDGYYEFYAELTDEAGIEELFSDGEDAEE